MQTYIYGGIIFAILGLGTYTITLEAQNARLKAEILQANDAIEAQNKAIEALALDYAAYAEKSETERKKTLAKYQAIKSEGLETCEAKLGEIERALSLFYGRAW